MFESFLIPLATFPVTFKVSIVASALLIILPLILPVLKVLIVEPFWLFRFPLIIPALLIVPVALLANKILIPLVFAFNVLLFAISKALVMLPVPL